MSLRTTFKALPWALALALTSMAAFALTLPSAADQEVLIKTSLLTFNDANVTGNYTVMREKASRPFRDQLSADQLKQSFKEFADKHIDFSEIAIKPISPTQESKISDDGVLLTAGTIAITGATVTYDLKFSQSEGQWKVIGINVRL